MWLYFFTLLLLVTNSKTNTNEIIIDYFLYKKVSSVVGFHCGDTKAIVELVLKLNDHRIGARIVKRDSGLNTNIILNNLYWKMGVFLDLRCRDEKDAVSLFDEASRSGLFKDLNFWLIINEKLKDTLPLVNDTSFSIVSDVTIAIPDHKDFSLYDIYNHCKYRGGIVNVTFAGFWNQYSGMNISLSKNKLARRWDFHGMVLRMSGLVNYRPADMELVDYLQDYNSKSLDTIAKFSYIIWLHVSDIFNFTIEPGEFTTWKENDTQGPIIGALRKKEMELAGTPASLTIERLSYVSAATTPWPFRSCFMFRVSESTDIKANEILRPFAAECWYLTILLIILCSFAFAMLFSSESIENKLGQYSFAFLLPIASLCQQGSAFCPENFNSRLGFLSMMLFSLLMYNYYSACIVSARLNEPITKMNDSLYSLSKSNLQLASEPQIYLNFFLKKEDWETKTFYTKKWLQIPESEKYFLPAEGIKRVFDGGFAYNTEPNTGYPHIERLFDNRKICELTEVNIVPPMDMALYVGKDGPFFEIGKIGLAKLYDMGIRRRQLKRWAARQPLCRKDILVVDSITIYESAPAFILLISGIIFAFGIFILENVVFYRKKIISKIVLLRNKLNKITPSRII